MYPNDTDGMTNSVDPDKNVPFDLDLHRLLRLICPHI